MKSIISKDMAPKAVLDMMAAIETLTGNRIQAIKTDHGREYRSTYFKSELSQQGIMIVENLPHHSETNAVAERVHRTLSTMGRTALICSKLTKTYWPEAFCHAVFIKNRIPHTALNGKTPLEIFKPETDIINERKRFRTFGEHVWIHNYTESDKISLRAINARILGYGVSYKTSRILTESRKVTRAQSPVHRTSYSKKQSSESSNNSDVEITPHDTVSENAEEQPGIQHN
jgi:hypothetical protein